MNRPDTPNPAGDSRENGWTPPTPPPLSTEPPDEALTSAVFSDITYATQSKAQELDVYLPAAGESPYPVIVWFHGGGFIIGDKREGVADYAGPMLAGGYAVVSANYRPSSEATFPAQIYDAKAVIRWVRANAEKYGFDPERIAAWGNSAGGFLAVLLGTSAGVNEMEDPGMGNPDQSASVGAVVDYFGPVDFMQMDIQHKQLGQKAQNNAEDSFLSQFLGGPPDRHPEICRAANPMSYIKADAPPFYIRHGLADDVVPFLQSVNLAEALEAAIGKEKVVLELVEDAGHIDETHRSPGQIRKALDFLDRHLG